MDALTFGCCLSASTVATAKNGRNDSFTPSRRSKSALACCRSRAIRVTSASTTVVSCALVCSDSVIRLAMTPRSRDIFSVRPRSGDGSTRGGASAGAPAGAAAAARPLLVAGSGSACGWVSWRDRAASSTSCLRIRPPTPVPRMPARSTSCSAASLRTSGVTYAPPVASPSGPWSAGCGAGAVWAAAGCCGEGGAACCGGAGGAACCATGAACCATGAGCGGACWGGACCAACCCGSGCCGSGSGACCGSGWACCGASGAAESGACSGAGWPWAGASGAGAAPEPPSSITASSTPTSTVSSSPTRIEDSVPDAGAGISVSTLSVDTSSSGSSASTRSPSFLSQRVTVPSVTLSPRRGIVTETDIGQRLLRCRQGQGRRTGSAVGVQWLAGQREVGLAHCLGLRRVGMDELRDLAGQRLPVVDQLGLGQQLPDPAADHVHADHGAVLLLDQLDRARGLQDLALAVGGEVEGERLDLLRAVLLDGLGLGEPDRGDLGLGVGDPGDAGVVDRHHRQAGEPLGDEDALAEADVCELRGGDQVADRRDRGDVGLAVGVDLDEAAVDRDTDLLVAEVGRNGAAADGHQQQLGLQRLAVFQRHPDALV